MILRLAISTLLLLAFAALASADSGPAIGEEATPFDPYHVTGPHAGKNACPLCTYHMIPGVQIWATSDGLEDAVQIAQWIEPRVKQFGGENLKAYVLFIPTSGDRAAAAKTIESRTAGVGNSIWRTVVPGPDDEGSTRAYKIDPKARTTTIVYVNRRVAAEFIDLPGSDADRDALLGAIDAAISREEPDPGAPKPVPLCSEDEPGRKLMLWGRVWDEEGRPLSKAAVFAYNTGDDGLYNPSDSNTRIPRIRGVAVTDERGFYSFKTVWPGAYPNASEPAHIHFAAVAPAHHLKYLLILFKGDPKITPQSLKGEEGEGVVVVDPQKQADSSFLFRQDVKLEGN